MNKLKGFLIVSSLTIIPAVANAAWEIEDDKYGDLNAPEDLELVILNIINWALGFCGLIAVLLIITGGVQYLTSAGDEDNATKGKNTIKYAIMGLVIAGIAYAVVRTIVTGVIQDGGGGTGTETEANTQL